MKKKLNKIIELPCEESSKVELRYNIEKYLVTNQDYIDGYIVIDSSRFEAVDVIIFEGCKDIPTITKLFSM